MAGGYASGKAAAEDALKTGSVEIEWEQVRREKDRIFAPMNREDGLSYDYLEGMIRKVMTELVGAERSENGLKTAIDKFKLMRAQVPKLKANNFHEQARAMETVNLLQIAEITSHAALFRKESRAKPYHYRSDYRDQDDQNWCGQVKVQKVNGEIEVSFLPIEYEPTTK